MRNNKKKNDKGCLEVTHGGRGGACPLVIEKKCQVRFTRTSEGMKLARTVEKY